MSDEPRPSLQQIRLEARLLAIENILAALFADINRRDGIRFEQFSAAVQEMHEQLRQQLVIQGTEPLVSDLITMEVEQALAVLIKKTEDYAQLD